MAEICPVCNEEIISQYREVYKTREGAQEKPIHNYCLSKFLSHPEKYGANTKSLGDEAVGTNSEPSNKDFVNSEPSNKDFVITLLICVFLGGLGVHRFFVDKIGTGVLMLVTFGGLGIWWIIDIILIVTGSFEDSKGRVIAYQPVGAVNREPAKDIPDEIEKFAELKDKGIITEEEFDKKKKELLQ